MLYNIQISRGIAALLVLVCHANLLVNPVLFDGVLLIGWSGLHFFFVLSGFIIFQAHFHQIGDPSSFWPYVYKRIRRIYPIYWAYTLLVLAAGLLAWAVLSKNLIVWTGHGPWTIVQSLTLWPTDMASGIMPVIPVAWTLTYEMLFYLLFGIALLVRPWISLMVVGVWLIAIACSLAGKIPAGPPIQTVATNPMNLEFLLGCLAGYLAKTSGRSWGRAAAPGLVASGLVLLSLAWFNAHADYSILGKFEPLQFGIPFFLIVLGLALLEGGRVVNLGPIRRVGVYLGDASYSIYLTHFVVIVALVPMFKPSPEKGTVLDFLLVTLIATTAGCLGYSLIEKPLLKRMPRRWPFRPSHGIPQAHAPGA